MIVVHTTTITTAPPAVAVAAAAVDECSWGKNKEFPFHSLSLSLLQFISKGLDNESIIFSDGFVGFGLETNIGFTCWILQCRRMYAPVHQPNGVARVCVCVCTLRLKRLTVYLVVKKKRRKRPELREERKTLAAAAAAAAQAWELAFSSHSTPLHSTPQLHSTPRTNTCAACMWQ